MVSRIAVVAALVLLGVPAVARAHGDPASDYLLVQSVFLPFNAKVNPQAAKELSGAIKAADQQGFKIKVAVIGSRYDLGTAFSLYKKAQKYAQFLGLELSVQYRDRLLVVMPNGYGYSIGAKPDHKGIAVVQKLPPPGKDPTKQVEGATAAIRELATVAGKPLPASGGGGSSKTRDRITLAAGLVALAAVLAAIVLWRRQRALQKPTAGV